MKKILAFLLAFVPLSLLAESQAVSQFRGLNNADSSILIGDTQAQSLQDVDITPSGNGIKKRDGYAAFKSIGVSTHPVRGGYYFRDVSGNDNIIHANDTKIFKSVAGAAYSAFVTTDTADSYYDFTDSQGYLWRTNSNRDRLLRYDGTTVTYYPSAPLGDQVEALSDRLVVSGVTANPNRLYFSAAADFTDFATGILETSAFTEDIGLPGQKINAIKVACGSNVMVWTRDTTSMFTAQNQFDLSPVVNISNTIGTLQPNSVIQDLGITYWQGQDKHFYAYDCNTVTKLSQDIDVSGFAGGESKLWTQTTQSDWDAGTKAQVTSAVTVGDVNLSTFTQTDTTTADFTAGSTSNTSVINNRVYLSTNNTNVDNNSFESGSGSDASNWTEAGSASRCNGSGAGCSACTVPSGTWSMDLPISGTDPYSFDLQILDASNNVLATPYSTSIPDFGYNLACSFGASQQTISLSSYVGRWIKLKFVAEGGASVISDAFLCSGSDLSFYIRQGYNSPTKFVTVDLITGGRSTTYSGTFTSQAFNTTFSTAGWLSSNAAWTTNSHAISMQTQASSDGSSWDTAVSWSTGSAPTSAGKQYIRYVVTLSTGGTTNGTALPYVDDVAFSARAASGTFTSQTKNIGSNATSFGNFSADQTLNSGTIGYFIRTATTEGGLASASWTALTRDAQISASINPWIQVKATFTITAATQDPSLQNFTVGWNEGSLARTFGSVDKDHRLMWSVGEGTATVASATYIYDPRFNSWLKYSVPFDAPARVGNSIYFGNPSSGNVYNWPSGTSDNGSAITAFWKSKDFIGGDPFSEKDFLTYSILTKTQTGSNLDIGYTINTSSTVSNNFSLTDSNLNLIRRINSNFPSGKFGTFINFKFGNDDADAPFEVYGFKFDYKPRPWRVLQ